MFTAPPVCNSMCGEVKGKVIRKARERGIPAAAEGALVTVCTQLSTLSHFPFPFVRSSFRKMTYFQNKILNGKVRW
jgi:type III secretion system FlhB-like substrate exporter